MRPVASITIEIQVYKKNSNNEFGTPHILRPLISVRIPVPQASQLDLENLMRLAERMNSPNHGESPDDRRRRRSSRDDRERTLALIAEAKTRRPGNTVTAPKTGLVERGVVVDRLVAIDAIPAVVVMNLNAIEMTGRSVLGKNGAESINQNGRGESPRQPPPPPPPPLERRGPFTPFGKGSGKGSWGKGRYGDGPFGKGKGKGFSGKGWSSGSRGFVWKHDKFEEEIKAEEQIQEEEEEKESEKKETPQENSPASTARSKPIKFDLYAEKLDDNVVQAVLDNVRERIDKRRDAMKQKREEREAEIQKMIAAGEDPFAKRPREGRRITQDGMRPSNRGELERGVVDGNARDDEIQRKSLPARREFERDEAEGGNRRKEPESVRRQESMSPKRNREDARRGSREEEKEERENRRERESSGLRHQHRGLKMEQQQGHGNLGVIGEIEIADNHLPLRADEITGPAAVTVDRVTDEGGVPAGIRYTVKLHIFGGRSGAGDTWTVYRRYSAFNETDHKLYRLLVSASEAVRDAVHLPELPPKTLLVPRLDAEFVAKRREGLQIYLDSLLPSLVAMTPSMQNVVCEFLEVPITARPGLCNPSVPMSGRVPPSEVSAQSFTEQLHGPYSIDNSLQPISSLPASSGTRSESRIKMTPDETARAKLEAFVGKLAQVPELDETADETSSLGDGVDDDSVGNDKVQAIRDFECWFMQNKPQFRELSIQLLFVGYDPTGRSYVYNENPHPRIGDSERPVGLLPEIGNFSEDPPVSACAALGFLRKLLSFEYNADAGIYTHVFKASPLFIIQGMHLDKHIRLNRGQSSRLDAFQITRTISPSRDPLLDIFNGDEWAVSEYSTWLKILGGGPAISGMIGGPPGVLVQRRTHAPRIMKSSVHGPSRGGLDVRKIAQDALLKVSTCVSTITYDDDIDDDQRNGSADGGCTVRSPAALLNTKIGSVRVDYHRLATTPPEHMARARLLHLPFHPEYVGALMYDHKAFIENVLELDTEGTTPKLVGGIQGDSDSSRSDFKVREKLLEFSYTHYNPLLHNVMLLSLPSRRHDMLPGESAASPRSMTMAASVGSPAAGSGRGNSVQEGTGTCLLTDLLDVVLNAPNCAPGFVKMQLLRAFKKLPAEDGGGYQIAYTSVDLGDELVSRGPGVPTGVWRGHDCCEVSAAAIFGMDSINLVSGDLLGEYIFFWPTLENFIYILQHVAPLLPAYPYEFHHPFIEWIYSGVAPDSMCLGEAASPRMPRGRSGSADSSSGLGRFGGAGLDHPVELSVES
ncbi:hypothetical protein Pmar_PMAR028257 [Perkinsus marinus ATCC 50983]|uniref:PX domain-containing protein n=1 Tax=Perkinsus marinus (strain ATCC 50983 / TXsc) TaxID=423536 RepID=C5LBE0_PERM5|nr:hypothetical protein Pmar_PMAR028257 [Perkinsus marinus ATCC 50983]EER06068.1 hypothetical protein Pmar_PMAR028257 [Perkinsus marinus ATCC 50983]|eukprot:XP_002774252.1 hypothetical protein Pmar_PMAR028257 [Perkinsus marinus ATCC 50983]